MGEDGADAMTLRRKPLVEQAELKGVAAVFIGILCGFRLAGAGARAGGFRPWFPASDGGGVGCAAFWGPCGGAGGGGGLMVHDFL